MKKLLEAAKQYYAMGLSVIPTIGKKAAIRLKKYQRTPMTYGELNQFFSCRGITGIAVILGRASLGGLACRDFDEAQSYCKWASSSSMASVLPTSKTSRGFHVYFLGPLGYATLPDGEYRADEKHYCLLPPSTHPDGPSYVWERPLSKERLIQVSPIREGLIHAELNTDGNNRVKPPKKHPKNPKTPTTPLTYFLCNQGRIRTHIEETLPKKVGTRHQKLFNLARRLKYDYPNEIGESFRKVIEEWHKRSISTIRTKDFDVSWNDFLNFWDQVRFPYGVDWLSRDTSEQTAIEKTRAFLNLIQSSHGKGNSFPLSCRILAIKVGISYPVAARLLKRLVSDGELILVKESEGYRSRIANEYVLSSH